MIRSGKFLDEIIEKISLLRVEISSKAKLGYTDLNKDCEEFVRQVLNLTYNWSLRNLNEKNAQFPGLDLGDEKMKIAFQISSSDKVEKIDHTLEQCLDKKHYLKFTSINVFNITSKKKSCTIKTITEPHFTFFYRENVKDFDDLYRDILLLDLDRRKAVYEYVEKEFSHLYKKLKGDDTNTSSSKNKKSETTLPSESTLIDIAESLKISKMTTSVHWFIRFDIISSFDISTQSIFHSIDAHKLIRNGNMIIPIILNPVFRKEVSTSEVKYIYPLRTAKASNHFSEERLVLKKDVVIYEFAEFGNSDIVLVDLNTPACAFLFLIFSLRGLFNECENLKIKVSIGAKSNRPALIHQNYSPFKFGFILENYQIGNNTLFFEKELSKISDEWLYNFIQEIYGHFTCSNPNTHQPFLKIDKTDFMNQIASIKQEFNIQ